MVFRKVYKPIHTESIQEDKVREMLIASANYAYLFSSKEDDMIDLSHAKIITTVGTPKRKRRLDNLTPDEKLLRKKLKNREAAQTSRDKKKAYINDLEVTVKKLREQNALLQKRVKILAREKEELQMKNEKLEKEIGQISQSHLITSEPAVLISAPLPRDLPVLHATVLSILLLITCQPKIALWIWTISIGLIMLQTHLILQNWKKLPILCQKKLPNWSLKLWPAPAGFTLASFLGVRGLPLP
ncbi:X box binding protein 1 isoform X1 [Rhodnius prolixus]|uniref:X box binding protein 1 isoform X1 n=1 Tax=Rhodnius prolixus TaxID=13249 RepID=UPI003D18EE57